MKNTRTQTRQHPQTQNASRQQKQKATQQYCEQFSIVNYFLGTVYELFFFCFLFHFKRVRSFFVVFH